MSATLSNTFTRVFPYIGQPTSIDVTLCNRKTKAVPIYVEWNVYWQQAGQISSVGVMVNLDMGRVPSSDGILKQVQSVKIDNTASTVPIYIAATDTNDVVTCPPQCIVTLNIITGQRQFVIFTAGLTTGFIPTTRIFFFEAMLPEIIDPAVQIVFDQWIGSPTIQRANALTPGYAPPALGDQFSSAEFVYAVAGGPVLPQSKIYLPAVASGFYYLTAISLFLTYGDFVFVVVPTDVISLGGALTDLTAGVDIITFRITVGLGAARIFVVDKTLYNLSGFNIRLDATHNYGVQYRSSNLAPGGYSSFALVTNNSLAYTYNPT